MSPITQLDHILYRWVTRNWPRDRIEKYVDTLRYSTDEADLPRVIFRTFESIDTKAAALLTHTSLMVASLGVISAVVAENHAQQAVLIAEVLVYLIISIMCLRCISLFHEPTEYAPDALFEVARDELILRRAIFGFCIRATIYLTVVVLISLPILFFVS